MTHPRMFDDADPILARVRELAFALPEAQEKVSHGQPAFFTGKVFAYYGGTPRGTDGPRHNQSVLVRADRHEQEAIRQLPGGFEPAYLGPYGWSGVDLEAHTDWQFIAELLEDSYRLTAPRRLMEMLDPR